jgi:hypothetical protein
MTSDELANRVFGKEGHNMLKDLAFRLDNKPKKRRKPKPS